MCYHFSVSFLQILIASDKILYQNSKYQTRIKKEHNIFCSDFLLNRLFMVLLPYKHIY